MKFNKGDTITPAEYYHGFENATVLDILNEGDRKYYKLKIINGTATIPVSAEVNYKLVEK